METTKTKRGKSGSGKTAQQVNVKKVPPKKGEPQSRSTQQSRRRSEDIPDRKRAYGKSKAKKRSGLQTLALAVQATAQENAAKRRAKAARSGKKRSSQPTPAVIYTQPQAFNRNRFAVQLVTVLAVVLALVLGMSVFFKVGTITVSGARVYTIHSVEEASGIKKGDSLFGFSRAKAAALITANLPYVKNVSFGIKLPDTVNIIIEEEDVVYSIKDQSDQWWLMNSEGRIVEQIREGAATNYTRILGVRLIDPIKGRKAAAYEGAAAVQETTDGNGVPQETEEGASMGNTGAQRLSAVLEILTALEDNDVVGSAASVDVTRMEEIELWYGTRYQVNLGDDSRLHEKIDYMTDVIAQMSDYQSGQLDISFRIWTNQVGYTPFSS